ncbi:MAG: alpha/beta hydrolase [Clostridia bacterium]|nr:alpha/beta hydrolase [Clostridia bacterium]
MKTNTIYKSVEGKNSVLAFYDKILSMSPVPYAEGDVMTSFGTTHFIHFGNDEKPPLVLLHGSTSNATAWIGDFLEYGTHFNCFVFDMPGEPGKSTENRLSWDNDEYSDWLNEVLNALNLTAVYMVGLSLGGFAALKFASKFNQRVHKLALISPGGLITPKASAGIKLIYLSTKGEKGIRQLMNLLMPDGFNSPELTEFFLMMGKHFIPRTEALKNLKDSELEKIHCPVYMITGDCDLYFDSRKISRRLKEKIPSSTIKIVKDGKHAMVGTSSHVIAFFLA